MKSKIHIPDQEKIRMMRAKGMPEKEAVTKLASMKRAKVKVSEKGPSTANVLKDNVDDYPYGLRIELDHDGMKKLGMKGLPKVGKKHKITAHAHVVSSSEHSESKGESRKSVSLQITHMKLGHDTNDEQGSGLEDQ